MENFFYNICGIVLGVILIFLSIYYFKSKKKGLGVLVLIHSILFIGVGTGGFFVPEKYSIVTIIVLLALCVVMIFTLLLCNNKDSANSSKK